MRSIVAKSWKPLLVIAVAAIVLRLLVGGGGPTDVKGAIERFTSIEFQAGTGEDAILKQHGIDPDDVAGVTERSVPEAEASSAEEIKDSAAFGISPTCGCEAAAANKWRGITFAAPEITLTRTGRSRFTEWLVEPSVPGLITMDNLTERVIPVDVYRYTAGARLTKQDHVGRFAAGRMPIVSSSEATVYSEAPVPIGAWIPYPGSDVTLQGRTNPELRNPEVVLDERYPSTIGTNKGSIAGYLQGYPAGEFLMPAVMQFEGGQTEIPGVLGPARDDEITVIAPRDGYAFRTAAIPLDDEERQKFRATAKDRERTLTPFGELTGHHAWLGRHDGGHVVVDAKGALAGKAYDKARATVEATPEKSFDISLMPDKAFVIDPPGPVKLTTVTAFDKGTQKFEYPPMPPSAGVNVFGEMRRLRLRGAVGALTVGGRDISIPTASDVEIDNISRLGTVDGHELVPFLSGPQSTDTLFDFSGVADVKVDGTSQTSFLRRRKSLIDGSVWLIGLLASVIALLEFRWSRREPPRPQERRRSPRSRSGRRRAKRGQ